MVTAQVAGRPVGVLLGIDTALNPFSIRPSYQALLKLPRAGAHPPPAGPGDAGADSQRGAVRRADPPAVAVPPAHHHKLASHVPDGRSAELRTGGKRQHRRHRRAHRTTRRTRSPTTTSPAAPRSSCSFPIVGYNEDNHDIIRTMLTDDATILGLSDGGAHCSSIVDAQRAELDADPLGPRPHPGRAAAAGNGGEAADQRDRRILRLPRSRRAGGRQEGRRQRDRLRRAAAARAGGALRPAEERPPAGAAGGRLPRTFVSGVPTFENGEYTGATPGRLVRAKAAA